MIELAFIACTLTGVCKDGALTFAAEAVTPMQCLVQAQPELAKWATEHPGWQVRRYTCRAAGMMAKA